MGTEERGWGRGRGRNTRKGTGSRTERDSGTRSAGTLSPPSGNLGALCGDGSTAVSSVALEQMSGRIFRFRALEALPVLLTETGLGCVGSKCQGALPAEALLSHPAHLLCTDSFSHGGHC